MQQAAVHEHGGEYGQPQWVRAGAVVNVARADLYGRRVRRNLVQMDRAVPPDVADDVVQIRVVRDLIRHQRPQPVQRQNLLGQIHQDIGRNQQNSDNGKRAGRLVISQGDHGFLNGTTLTVKCYAAILSPMLGDFTLAVCTGFPLS